MDVKEMAKLLFKLNMIGCADPVTHIPLATGDWRPTSEWFGKYSVETTAQVRPFIHDRPPDAIDHDGFVHWWQLENGVILAIFGEEPYDGGKIIPPDAGDPPPIKGFQWWDSELREALGDDDPPDETGGRVYYL